MKKYLFNPLLMIGLCSFSCSFLEAVPSSSSPSSPSSKTARSSADSSNTQEKYDIMKRDQIDPSDALAIPFDDSEVEDEEQINRDEKRNVFPLPSRR